MAPRASFESRRASVLAITSDRSSCTTIATALRAAGMFALATTPSAARRIAESFFFDVVVLLGDIGSVERDQIVRDILSFDHLAETSVEILDVIDPRIVVHAARRALRGRRK
jgi:hypothetical protein